MRLKISARASHLARLQAFQVGQAIEKISNDIQIEYFFRDSLGDKNLTDPLWKMPEKGVFTEDFYQDLVDEKTDFVVHSWKDLPTEHKLDTVICATLPRADQRDLLIFKKNSIDRLQNKKEIQILTSSQRRIYNLEKFLLAALPFQPEKIIFKDIRGNIPTRMEKLFASKDFDGLILAKAALDRLLGFSHPDFVVTQAKLRKFLSETEFMVLPLSENPNAAAQGALAIEVKKSRRDLIKLAQKINHQPTFESVQQERDILASYGGGCHQKIGVAILNRDFGKVTFLKGLTDQNIALNVHRLDLTPQLKRPPPSFKKISLSRVQSLFKRTELNYRIPLGTNAFYVSRIHAYRECVGIIWAAGTKTWKKLAQKNVWVHGCSESLGEFEDPRLETLVPHPLQWAKLTHKDADSEKMFNVATYQLILNLDLPEEVLQAENFFWMSAYQFDLVTEKYPAIKNKIHCCGVGLTFKGLSKRLTHAGNGPFLYLDEADWKTND